MVRIVYGVSGEGSGHSSRAREVATHLEGAGHVVRIVSYDRGVKNLAGDFDVVEVEGLGIATRENEVSLVRTFTENLAKLPDGWKSVRRLRAEVFGDFDPDVVITDFEPMTAYLANRNDLPLITIDNQHRMRYLRSPKPPGLEADAKVIETIIRMLVPKPDVSLITTFWFGEAKNQRTFAFPPILRRSVLEAKTSDGEHVLVYLTKGFDALLDQLRSFPRERFRVYGSEARDDLPNAEFLAPSRNGFLADLASAKGVVSTAGFTLMTEALHLGKPMLALPMRGQYEQELNAFLLEDAGIGRGVRAPDRAALGEFLYRIPEFEAALETYPRADNTALFERIDALLANEAAEAKDYHARRR